MRAAEHVIEVFFDGECPICRREVDWVRRMDRRGRILFTDISAPAFDAGLYGRSLDELMARMHGRLPDGSWIEGIEVFRRMYGAVGFGPLVALTRLPVIRGMLDALYARFAANRLRWTGRCDGACATHSPPA